jgi:hypothetical protein
LYQFSEVIVHFSVSMILNWFLVLSGACGRPLGGLAAVRARARADEGCALLLLLMLLLLPLLLLMTLPALLIML